MNNKPRRINMIQVADVMKQVVVASLIGLNVTVVVYLLMVEYFW